LVVETAAGLELGGNAEKTARRTIAGSPAMARASGVAEGFSGYSTMSAWVDAGLIATTAIANGAALHRRTDLMLDIDAS
jgi:hypothetical protein